MLEYHYTQFHMGKIISRCLCLFQHVDFEPKRGLFLSIGFAISFLLVITAFDWKFYDDGNLIDLGQVTDDFEEMLWV